MDCGIRTNRKWNYLTCGSTSFYMCQLLADLWRVRMSLPTNLINKFTKNSLICVYLVPFIILVSPFLVKFVIDRSFLINANIPFIQLGLVTIWFIVGDIISRQHVRYFFGRLDAELPPIILRDCAGKSSSSH